MIIATPPKCSVFRVVLDGREVGYGLVVNRPTSADYDCRFLLPASMEKTAIDETWLLPYGSDYDSTIILIDDESLEKLNAFEVKKILKNRLFDQSGFWEIQGAERDQTFAFSVLFSSDKGKPKGRSCRKVV